MVFEQVLHKQGCSTSTEDSQRLEIGFGKKKNCTIHVAKTKGADQLHSYCEADLRLCFRLYMQIVGFPMWILIIISIKYDRYVSRY